MRRPIALLLSAAFALSSLSVLAQTAPQLAGLSQADYVMSTNTAGTTYVLKNGKTGAVSTNTDADALLQSAVTACPTTGCTIFLAAGTYPISTYITLKDGITLDGAGPGKTIIQPTGNFAQLLYLAASSANVGNVTVRNIGFKQNSQVTTFAIGLFSTGAYKVQDVTIEGCSFDDFAKSAILAQNFDRLTIQDNVFRNTGAAASTSNWATIFAAQTGATSTQLVYSRNKVYGIGNAANTNTNGNGAVRLANKIDGVVVTGNHFEGMRRGSTAAAKTEGVFIYGDDVDNVVISGNTFRDGDSSFVSVSAVTNYAPKNFTISNNIFDGYSKGGSAATPAVFLAGVENASIIGNSIINPGQSANVAIEVNTCRTATVSGNTVSGPFESDGLTGSGDTTKGIYVSGYNINVTGNSVNGNPKYCYLVGNGSNVTVSGNSARDCITDGFYCNADVGMSRLLVEGNQFHDDSSDSTSQDHGILIGSNVTNSRVVNNIISGYDVSEYSWSPGAGTYRTDIASSTGTTMQSSLPTNAIDAANSVWGANNGFVFEGTADGSETTLTVTDPTADRTITLPDATGTVALVAGSSTELQYRNGTTLGAAPIILDSDGTKQDRLVSTADLVGPHGQPVGGDTGGSYFFPGQYRATSLARAATSRTTMASTASVSVPIAFIGDSITAYLSTAIPAQWQRRGALGGMGYEPANDSDVYSYTPATTMRTKTYAGTWTLRHPGSVAPSSAIEWGINGSSATADTSDDTLTYTVSVPCNRITVFYAVQAGGGTFQWSTDNSSWTDVSTAGSDALGYVTSGGDSIGIYYGATAEVGNTLYLRYKSGSTGPVTIYGLYSYTRYINQQPDRDNVVPLWLAAGGITLGSRTWAAGVDEDGTGSVCTSAGGATLTTGWATRGVGNIYLDALLDLLLPAEIVVALGANDGCVGGTASCCTAGSTPAEYASDLSTLLDGLAAYFPATYRPDVILVPPWQRGQATGGSTTYFEKYNATRQPGYRKAAYTQARARGYSVADLPSFWGGFTAATAAGLMVDSVHQTQAGRQVLATWYSEFLLDRGWPNAQRSVDPYCGVKTLASGVLSAPACNYVQVASSGALTSITTCAREDKGRRLTLECTSTATWTIATGQSAATAPIVNSAWTCGAGKSISFTCDGTNWREIARAGEANTAAQTACQSFGAINAAANTTVYLGTSQASTQDMIYLPVPADATLKGIACVNVGALSGGTATITVCKNGGATCSDVTLSYSSADASLAGKSDTTCTTNCTYAAGDKIVVKSVNDASYAPTTVDWTCNVCYTMVAW